MRMLIASLTLFLSFAAQAEELAVVGRLDAVEPNVAACGILRTAAITEYQVVKVVSGQYKQKKLYVVHPCPEKKPLPAVGKTYNLTVTTENKDSISVYSRQMIPQGFTTYFLSSRSQQD